MLISEQEFLYALAMELNSKFVRRIEEPEHSVLKAALADACERARERLTEMGFRNPEEWLVRKAAFASFYDWERDSPDYVFLLPDPGNIGTEYTDEIHDFESTGPTISSRQQVGFYRDLARGWFLNHRTDFPTEFFPLLQSNGLIEYPTNWQTYIRDSGFFDDFYMTDVVKYRIAGNSSSALEEWAFRRHLKRELIHIDPKIIFVFGGRAWGTIREYLSPVPYGTKVRDDSKITNAHGRLYYTNSQFCAFILPLGHMSGNSWWQFPPEEYIDRLKAGLSELQAAAKTGFTPPDKLCNPENQGNETTALDKLAQKIGTVDEFGQ